VEKPRFYAFRVINNCYGTIGGIKIDEKMRVLDKYGSAIAGLYAAGADACNHYGIRPTYNIKLAGGTLSWALNSGRFAGENSARFAKEGAT
jgi:fumarate reductase flavoprotein subunit